MDDIELTPEQDKLDKRIAGLRETNLRLLHEIRNSGANIDLTFPRVEMLMNFLLEEGIITMDQRLKEQETWELHLRPSLKDMADEITNARLAAGQPQKRASGLILPGSNGA